MDFQTYLNNSIPELHNLIKELVAIPAPSHQEAKRAEYVKQWLEEIGATGIYIDEANNCVFPMNCGDHTDIIVFEAHTDTVFPDLEPFEMKRDEKRFYAPGVGDDTACLAIMLLTIKYFLQENKKPICGILFVANSCEEGLGNLKGTRKIMETYGERVRRFYTLDGMYDGLVTRCVGSHRYLVTAKTEGGHSFASFGKPNAIAELSRVIEKLYGIEVPEKENTKTTYNVGVIEGGTSVNSIAQSAKMLYEYRSDDKDCIDWMKKRFDAIIENANSERKATFTVETVGVRPCGNISDQKTLDVMIRRAVEICESTTGIPCRLKSGSTDCNIPASLGIPSVCIGVYLGGGAHTREEYLEIDSLPKGMNIFYRLLADYFRDTDGN